MIAQGSSTEKMLINKIHSLLYKYINLQNLCVSTTGFTVSSSIRLLKQAKLSVNDL